MKLDLRKRWEDGQRKRYWTAIRLWLHKVRVCCDGFLEGKRSPGLPAYTRKRRQDVCCIQKEEEDWPFSHYKSVRNHIYQRIVDSILKLLQQATARARVSKLVSISFRCNPNMRFRSTGKRNQAPFGTISLYELVDYIDNIC